MNTFKLAVIALQNAGGEKYGRERLLDVIASSGNNATETIQSICQSVTDFSGTTSLEADIAIAVLEYTPEAAAR